MFRHIEIAAALIAALVVAAPAAAVVKLTTQTKTIQLGSLDTGPKDVTFDFDAFDVPGQHLTDVTLTLDAKINGQVSATNFAILGNANARKRSISAFYTIDGYVTGAGLAAVGGGYDGQTKTGVAGLGTTVTLNSLNPSFAGSDSVTSSFSPFLSGPVAFELFAEATFGKIPSPNVVFGRPQITSGRAIATLTYSSIVPEPATWTLLLAGFGMTGLSLRRRTAIVSA